jgi:hypothetical protein
MGSVLKEVVLVVELGLMLHEVAANNIESVRIAQMTLLNLFLFVIQLTS